MRHLLLLLLVASCSSPPPAQPEAPRPTPPPAPSEANATAAPSAAKTDKPKDKDKEEEGPTNLEPYKVTATASAPTAATNEEVTVTWSLEGGPKGKSVSPRVRVTVDWIEKGKTVGTDLYPAVAEPCAAPAIEAAKFPMQAKRNASIKVEAVACRARAPIEESRAKSAPTMVSWVSPYVDMIDAPTVLAAGSTGKGTITFKGLEGPGAPPKVIVRSSNAGVTITKQPTVTTLATFDFAVKSTVSGDVKLTAEHVNTDGSGRILGTISKSTTVKVR